MSNILSTSPETRASVERLLADLCAEHGITPAPRLEWSKRMRRLLGRAYVHRRLIRLSAWLDDHQAHATLRHELAHIVVGPSRRRPHGAQWRAWAVRLGADARATSHRPPALASERPDTRRYTALECPGCGLRLVRQRVLHGLYCKACGPRRGMLVRAGQGARAAMIAWVTGRTIEASRTEIAEIG